MISVGLFGKIEVNMKGLGDDPPCQPRSSHLQPGPISSPGQGLGIGSAIRSQFAVIHDPPARPFIDVVRAAFVACEPPPALQCAPPRLLCRSGCGAASGAESA